MTTFPNSPRLLKGTIVGIDIFNSLASVIVFQYNPDTMTSPLQAQTTGDEGGDKSEALRLKGAPVETSRLEPKMDAPDRHKKA